MCTLMNTIYNLFDAKHDYRKVWHLKMRLLNLKAARKNFVLKKMDKPMDSIPEGDDEWDDEWVLISGGDNWEDDWTLVHDYQQDDSSLKLERTKAFVMCSACETKTHNTADVLCSNCGHNLSSRPILSRYF